MKIELKNLLFRELYQDLENLTVEECKRKLALVWKHVTGKSHAHCPDHCPWKIDPTKEPIVRLGNLALADDQIESKIYTKIWKDYCLSNWFIRDLMSCRNGGSYVEALNGSIYNRELVVKNRPVNTLSEGNQVKYQYLYVPWVIFYRAICESIFS